MTYDEAIQYIQSTRKFGWKLGLHNISYLLESMGNPQDNLQYVHVAGTNGKGSTVTLISSVLIAAGYKVGIFTSPYIERFSERIKVNENEIEDQELARITGYVKEKVIEMTDKGEKHPTEFEIVTAIAFLYFNEKKCDIVVLEVGLGGRFDSTNVIKSPLVSVITTINYDHMDLLGGTLEEIAFEKAGIIKDRTDVVLYPALEQVEKVILDVCQKRNARHHCADFSKLRLLHFDLEGQIFDYKNYKKLRLSLLGEHQIKNAAVALETIDLLQKKGYAINEKAIREGIEQATWTGRFEVLQKKPVFMIDGAHNIEGVHALADNLNRYFPGQKITFIFGVLKDKDYQAMIKTISPLASRIITITPNSDRALSAKDLENIVKPYCKEVIVSDTISRAVDLCLEISLPEDVICAFGSLYYIGEVRNYFS